MPKSMSLLFLALSLANDPKRKAKTILSLDEVYAFIYRGTDTAWKF